jgi:asparagine synthase (glutamine-hydrolysing)
VTAIVPADERTVAYGVPVHLRRRAPASVRRARATPAAALVDAIAQLLDDRPCLVEFSGGCDSSLVLAAARQACRQVGHDAPIPVSYRYDDPRSEESDWQHLVLDLLGLRDRHLVVDARGRAELLAPEACRLLREVGLVWPGTILARAGLWAELPAGVLLTGEGGDEILGVRRATAASQLSRRALRPGGRRALLGAALHELSPHAARQRGFAAAALDGYGPWWLEEGPRRELCRLIAAELADEPLDPARFPRYHLSLARVWVVVDNLRAIAARYGLQWEAPLLDPAVAASIARSTPRHAYLGRAALLDRYFTELLPGRIRHRESKALFTDAHFGPSTRAYLAEWSGDGAPDGVDVDWLRRHWRGRSIAMGTHLLAQAVWLAAESLERPTTGPQLELANARR